MLPTITQKERELCYVKVLEAVKKARPNTELKQLEHWVTKVESDVFNTTNSKQEYTNTLQKKVRNAITAAQQQQQQLQYQAQQQHLLQQQQQREQQQKQNLIQQKQQQQLQQQQQHSQQQPYGHSNQPIDLSPPHLNGRPPAQNPVSSSETAFSRRDQDTRIPPQQMYQPPPQQQQAQQPTPKQHPPPKQQPQQQLPLQQQFHQQLHMPNHTKLSPQQQAQVYAHLQQNNRPHPSSLTQAQLSAQHSRQSSQNAELSSNGYSQPAQRQPQQIEQVHQRQHSQSAHSSHGQYQPKKRALSEMESQHSQNPTSHAIRKSPNMRQPMPGQTAQNSVHGSPRAYSNANARNQQHMHSHDQYSSYTDNSLRRDSYDPRSMPPISTAQPAPRYPMQSHNNIPLDVAAGTPFGTTPLSPSDLQIADDLLVFSPPPRDPEAEELQLKSQELFALARELLPYKPLILQLYPAQSASAVMTFLQYLITQEELPPADKKPMTIPQVDQLLGQLAQVKDKCVQSAPPPSNSVPVEPVADPSNPLFRPKDISEDERRTIRGVWPEVLALHSQLLSVRDKFQSTQTKMEASIAQRITEMAKFIHIQTQQMQKNIFFINVKSAEDMLTWMKKALQILLKVLDKRHHPHAEPPNQPSSKQNGPVIVKPTPAKPIQIRLKVPEDTIPLTQFVQEAQDKLGTHIANTSLQHKLSESNLHLLEVDGLSSTRKAETTTSPHHDSIQQAWSQRLNNAKHDQHDNIVRQITHIPLWDVTKIVLPPKPKTRPRASRYPSYIDREDPRAFLSWWDREVLGIKNIVEGMDGWVRTENKIYRKEAESIHLMNGSEMNGIQDGEICRFISCAFETTMCTVELVFRSGPCFAKLRDQDQNPLDQDPDSTIPNLDWGSDSECSEDEDRAPKNTIFGDAESLNENQSEFYIPCWSVAKLPRNESTKRMSQHQGWSKHWVHVTIVQPSVEVLKQTSIGFKCMLAESLPLGLPSEEEGKALWARPTLVRVIQAWLQNIRETLKG